MKKGAAIAAVSTIVIGGTLVLVISRKAKAEEEGGLPAGGKVTAQIEIYDASGNPVSTNLKAGQSYKVRVTATNQLKEGGVLVPATLNLGISAGTELVTLIEPVAIPLNFGAGETLEINFEMAVPDNAAGAGSIAVYIESQAGQPLATADNSFNIESTAELTEFYMPPNMTINITDGSILGMYWNCEAELLIRNTSQIKGIHTVRFWDSEGVIDYTKSLTLAPGEEYVWTRSQWVDFNQIPKFTMYAQGDWVSNNYSEGVFKP